MSEYNGWTNYETWAVALWIDNDQGTYSARCEMVEECVRDADDQDKARYALQDRLKNWVEDEMMPDLGASLASDLLSAAVSEVDWNEIAENFLSDDEDYARLGQETEETE